MCKAIRDMMDESRALGQSEGRTIGLREGKELGIDENTRRIVENMIRRGMADDDIMAIAECSRELINEVKNSR